jgi:hypothetical protein
MPLRIYERGPYYVTNQELPRDMLKEILYSEDVIKLGAIHGTCCLSRWYGQDYYIGIVDGEGSIWNELRLLTARVFFYLVINFEEEI